MGWHSYLTTFGAKLDELIRRKEWSEEQFAAAVDDKQPHINAVKAGKRKPPLKGIDAWADVLGIEGAEREYFLDLAALTRAPERVLRMFEPSHPAQKAIRAAVERDLTAKRAAEDGAAYEAKPPKRPRSGR